MTAVQRFEVRVWGERYPRATYDDRGEADRRALAISCETKLTTEVKPITVAPKPTVKQTYTVEEMRAVYRKAARVIAARRRAGVNVDSLVQSRDRLKVALRGCEPAGRVEVRRARATGTLVGLYRSVEGGMENDPELPWSVVCEDHSCLVSTATRATARSAMACPNDWCPVCRGEEPDPRNEP